MRLSALSRFLASGSVGAGRLGCFRKVVVGGDLLVGYGGGKLGRRMERMMMHEQAGLRLRGTMGWDGMDIFWGGTWKRGGRLFCFILCAGPFFY